MLKIKNLYFIGVLGLFFCSCSVSPKVALGGMGGRSSYNSTLQTTTSEQMLLNLVRLRFCESPYFLDVNGITTQFTYSTKAKPTFFIPGFNKSNPFELGGEFFWQNQPTIQYAPLEGQAFATQLLKPIDISIIQELILGGWDIDRVFKLTIQNFNNIHNAPNAGGPIPDSVPHFEEFFKMTRIMREFQLNDSLHVGSNCIDKIKNDNEHQSEGSNKPVRLVFPSTGENAQELASMLHGCKKRGDRYVLDIDIGFGENAKSGVIPRSILGCMYYLSLGVIVPEKDLKLGVVPIIKNVDGTIFNWQDMLKGILTIHNCSSYPEKAFVSIKYRNYWYYIDNYDISSKRTFVLLQLLYNLQSESSKAPPTLLSLPIGG